MIRIRPVAARLATLMPAILVTYPTAQNRTPVQAPPPATTTAPADALVPEVVEELWPDGRPRVRREVLRQPDGSVVEHGLYQSWYANGRKEYEGRYVQGKVDGLHRRWHPNGRPATEEHFCLGLRQGPRWVWDERGLLRKQEHFLDDRPVGLWRTWNSKGELRSQHMFDARSTSQPTSDKAP